MKVLRNAGEAWVGDTVGDRVRVRGCKVRVTLTQKDAGSHASESVSTSVALAGAGSELCGT